MIFQAQLNDKKMLVVFESVSRKSRKRRFNDHTCEAFNSGWPDLIPENIQDFLVQERWQKGEHENLQLTHLISV